MLFLPNRGARSPHFNRRHRIQQVSVFWLIQSLLLFCYTMSGIQKIVGFGPDMFFTESFASTVLGRSVVNDGYPLKHDVDLGVGLVNPLDWLNVLVMLRTHGYDGPFNLDFKPPRTTSNFGVWEVSFPTAVDRFITLWDIAGEVSEDPVLKEAGEALRAGGSMIGGDLSAVVEGNKELLTLHELISHRLFQILIGQHRGRTFSS